MKKFRKVWTKEINEWFSVTKGMTPSEAYSFFLKTFPQITDVTRAAFCNQRSKMKCAGKCSNPNVSRKPRPLYSEHIKKGYVRIKIAQPNEWVSKSKWVYMETHPWEDFSERSNYIFLDGDNRNFDPKNIERVPLKVMGVFNLLGGCEKGQPEITRLRIVQAKLKLATLDAGEKLGLVAKVESKGRKNPGRLFIEERNRKAREYNSSPERKKIISERAKKYREKLKTEYPEKYKEITLKQKVYNKKYYEGKIKNG